MAEPTGNILVYPAHDRCHLLVDFLHTVQVPTDGFVMEYTIAERPECIQRCRYILSFPFLLRHEGERPAQVFPEQTHSLLSSDTQNPRVSSATIFDGVMLSCLPAICLLACVI